MTLFLSGAAASIHFAKRLVSIVRRVRAHGINHSDRVVLPGLVLAALLSWAFLYIVSLGPAIVLSSFWRATENALQRIYTPLIWLHEHTSLKEPLEWYASFWERPIPVRSAWMFVLSLVALAIWGLWPKLKKLYPFRELIPWLFRPEIRRIFFAILGVPLAVGGALAILTGLVWLAKGLSDADQFLAKGFGASVVGLASLWMAFHPRSPLRGKSEP
ncbi:MAG: hypothetical protein HY000_09890 [Planctomycetes bacterium]|nr:hypothetical protein [Planctomycetota bacterium]